MSDNVDVKIPGSTRVRALAHNGGYVFPASVLLGDENLEAIANAICASSAPEDPKLEIAHEIARALKLDWARPRA